MNKEDMEKLKKVEKEILDYFVDICNKNNLTYFLSSGTLLGAVRHQGFIPWDDDIDVMMFSKDYQKFLEIMKKDKDDKYFLQDITTEKYYHVPFAKIRKKSTCMIEEEWKWIKINKGINIDIFQLYPYPNNGKEQKKFDFNLKLIKILLSKNNKTNSLKNKIIFSILKIIPRSITNKIANNINLKMMNYNGEYDFYKMVDGIKLNKKCFDKTELLFENTMYTACTGYDEILRNMYGDYMEFPPIENRCGHGKIILSFDKDYEDLKNK